MLTLVPNLDDEYYIFNERLFRSPKPIDVHTTIGLFVVLERKT